MTHGARRTATLVLLLAAPLAQAHGSVQGLGHFFGGVVHPLLEPSHLIALLALGLLLGQRGLKDAHPALPGFTAGTVLGLVSVGRVGTPEVGIGVLVLAALSALLVVAARPLPRSALTALATLLALGIAWDSRPEDTRGAALAATLAGTGLGMLVALLNVASWTQLLRRPWLRVGVRVVASWLGAAALLVLALSAAEYPGRALAQGQAGAGLPAAAGAAAVNRPGSPRAEAGPVRGTRTAP